jgi:Arc/MetJ-type ribon-helix-helix transcriptional regulator
MGPDEKAWDWMRRLAPYTRYRNISSFIREGIDLLLKREDEQPSGWIVGRPRRA